MRLITRDVRAKEIIEEWRERNEPYWKNPQYAGDTKQTYEKLIALGDSPTLDEVFAITKNGYHTYAIICDSCSCEADVGIRFVEEEWCNDIQSCDVCAECVSKGMGLLEDNRVHDFMNPIVLCLKCGTTHNRGEHHTCS